MNQAQHREGSALTGGDTTEQTGQAEEDEASEETAQQ
jgi:hypothetical protein